MNEAWALSFTLVLVRVATIWMTIPIWGTLNPPRMVKLGLVLSLALFWFSGLEQPMESALLWSTGTVHWFYLLILVSREVLIGGLIGFAFHALLVPIQIAGAYIGQELGLSLATLTDPNSGATTNIVATIMQAIGVVMIFVFDLHHFVIYCIDLSFQWVPVGEAWRFDAISVAIAGFCQVTEQGLMISMPVAIVLFITLIAILVLARAVPALNLFSVGMPIRLILGLLAMLVFLPQLLVKIDIQLDAGINFLDSLLRSL